MNREVNMTEEELRLQNSSELMYGNNDFNQIFPFDVRMRFKYLVYHESIGLTEDEQQYSKRSTRRFTFISPSDWDSKYMPKGKKSFFEKQQKVYTILHDPIKQAESEGVKIKGYHIDKTGLSLKEKLKNAKPAAYVGKSTQAPNSLGTITTTPYIPLVEEKEIVSSSSAVTSTFTETEQPQPIKRAGRPRKGVDND